MAQAGGVHRSEAHQPVADMRISYESGKLEDGQLDGADPMEVFDAWIKEAVTLKVCQEPNIISLATADVKGRPSVRAMLLKGYDARGFIFFSNYESCKGRDLAANPAVAFSVYWEKLQRQVRVEGVAQMLPESESEAYFHSRPRGSQVGAWVSRQSEPLPGGRAELDASEAAMHALYIDESAPVPKPPHWGGYVIVPTAIEFWQGRPSRLHDRLRFTRASPGEPWVLQRLQP